MAAAAAAAMVVVVVGFRFCGGCDCTTEVVVVVVDGS